MKKLFLVLIVSSFCFLSFNLRADGKVLFEEARELEGKGKASADKKLYRRPDGERFTGGYGKSGEEANGFYFDASLKFLEAARLYNSNGEHVAARDCYKRQLGALDRMGRKPVNPIYFFLHDLAKHVATDRLNKQSMIAKLPSINTITLKPLRGMWNAGGPSGQQWVREKWENMSRAESRQFEFTELDKQLEVYEIRIAITK